MPTICIEVSDDGQMAIGIEPPEGEEGAEGGGLESMPGMSTEGMEPAGAEGGEDKSYLTPVANEEELMVKLTELLQQVRPQGMQGQTEGQADASLEAGFKRQRGGEMM